MVQFDHCISYCKQHSNDSKCDNDGDCGDFGLGHGSQATLIPYHTVLFPVNALRFRQRVDTNADQGEGDTICGPGIAARIGATGRSSDLESAIEANEIETGWRGS